MGTSSVLGALSKCKSEATEIARCAGHQASWSPIDVSFCGLLPNPFTQLHIANVDWAMLNFMQDWFPKETKEKIKQNETEVVEEQLAELGLDSHQGCTVM